MPKDTHSTLPAGAELVLPERVTVALAELAGAAREGLLALAVGTGLGVLGSLLEADVDRLVGPKGRHQPDRVAVRHGTQPGQVTLGGRRVRVDRPRVRSADGAAELPLPTWQAFASTELLDQLALERMLAKLSCRRYRVGLEPVGSRADQASSGTSKSAISRRFVAATERALAELLAQDLSGLDLVALMVDGVRVAEHCCVVALGITIDGTKIPLGLAEGATENATVVTDLLANLRDRGLDTTRPLLVVIDGAKALRRAVTDVFDHPILQRCQSISSAMSPTGSQTPSPPRWPSGCAAPTTTPTPWSPRPNWRRSLESWTVPIRVLPPACAKAWPRRSRSGAWACHRPWPGRCGPRTRSSR
jgi:putative transposase